MVDFLTKYGFKTWNVKIIITREKLSDSLFGFPISHGYVDYLKGEGEKIFTKKFEDQYCAHQVSDCTQFPFLGIEVKK